MKKSLKAALLSGLIFPGVGQFWLKHALRGIALVAAVSASLAVIVVKVSQQAFAILEKIESEGGAVDLVAIANTANASSSADGAIKIASLVLVACWVISTVDAYLLGSKKDREELVSNTDSKAPAHSKAPYSRPPEN
jgi:TM2 domain-containing membrane protein YozV